MMRKLFAGILAVSVACAAVPASATMTSYSPSQQSTFNAAAPNQYIENYSSDTANTAITSQGGISYTAGSYTESSGGWTNGGTMWLVAATNATLTLTFSTLQWGFAALFGVEQTTASGYTLLAPGPHTAQTLTLNFFNGATNVGSGSVLTTANNSLTFSGWISNIAFNSVQISGGGTNNSVVLDSVTRIPEPASMALLGTGLLGLFAARRRRNKG